MLNIKYHYLLAMLFEVVKLKQCNFFCFSNLNYVVSVGVRSAKIRGKPTGYRLR